MSADQGHAGISPGRFAAPATSPVIGPRLRIPLHVADRPLIGEGDAVEPGQALVERFREQEVMELPTDAALLSLASGEALDLALLSYGRRRGHPAARPGDRARVIGHTRDGRTFLAVGRGDMTVYSPAAGHAERVQPGRLDLRAEGLGLTGLLAWGRPVSGRLLIAVSGPDAEMRAPAVDVGAAGAVLVAGARLDIEALTRARAIGVAGVVCGGIVGRELAQIEESEMRQRAALHAAAPFGIIALGGYGRRPIAQHVWDMLGAAEGRTAGIAVDDRMLVLGGDPAPIVAAGRRGGEDVLVTGGELVGREGRLLGLAGQRRWPGGVYAPGASVELEGPAGIAERHCLPLSDLERLG